MKTDSIKSHLLIGNKILGTLFYTTDKNGIGYLKLSFDKDIEGLVKWTDILSTLPANLQITEPVHLEISYKFGGNDLGIKQIIKGKKPMKEFYKIALPFTSPLFVLKIKDWKLLNEDVNSHNPLPLTPPSSTTNSVIVIFSFFGANNLPFGYKEYPCEMGVIDLPENNFSKFYIGIAEDTNNQEQQNIMVMFPNNLFNKVK